MKPTRLFVLCGFILLAACTRALPLCVPGIWNFTAIGAFAIFAGSQFPNAYFAFTIPLLAMALADVFIGEGFNTLVYVGFIVMVACGIYIRGRIHLQSVAAASLIGTILFYLITNFAYCYSPDLYPHNLAGVLRSYTMALPFLRNMLIGDAFYGLVLFGGFYLIENSFSSLSTS